MIEAQIEYSSRKVRVVGPEKVAAKSIEELFEFVQVSTIDVSRRFLQEEQRRGDFPKRNFLTIVDNNINKKVENVNVFGKVEYRTKLDSIAPVLLDAMRFVVSRSPTRTGYYQSTHVLMKNDTVVAKGIFQANTYLKSNFTVKENDIFRVINLAPYARKLERRGYTRGIGGKAIGQNKGNTRRVKTKAGGETNAPNGAYWLSRRALRRKYPALKNNIRFSFVPVNPQKAAGQNSKAFNSYTFQTGKGKGRPYLYPSITISVNPIAFTPNAGFTEAGI